MTVPLDEDEFHRWWQQADSAAETARLARAGGRHEWACFLWEQAAQLAVKGLLHGLGLEAWGHDLTVLVERASEQLGAAWPSRLAEPAARLSRHYIASRYPDAHPSGPAGAHFTGADSRQAEHDAQQIHTAVESAWDQVRSS